MTIVRRPYSDNEYTFPGVIVIDNQEQLPYRFDGLRTDADRDYARYVVRTVRKKIPTGDYSLEGFEDVIAIERKSLDDAYRTFSQDRKRWERELERMKMFAHSWVMIESSWKEIFNNPPEFSSFDPKCFYRSVISWNIRYPTIHFFLAGSRAFAEKTTFRILEKFYFKNVFDPRAPKTRRKRK